MKLIKCPKGYIGTKVGLKDIYIDRQGLEERGFTLVDDDVARVLLEREGFEISSPEEYKGNLQHLCNKVSAQLSDPGVLSKYMNDPSEWKMRKVEDREVKVEASLEDIKGKYKCWMCKASLRIMSFVRRLRKQ